MVAIAQVSNTEISAQSQVAQKTNVRMVGGFRERIDDVLHLGMIGSDAESVWASGRKNV